MSNLRVYKVLSLPKELVPNAIYLIAEQKSKTVQIVVANKAGDGVLQSINETHIRSMVRDELLLLPKRKNSYKNFNLFIILILLFTFFLMWYWFQIPKFSAYQVKAMPLVQTVVSSGQVETGLVTQVGSEITGVVRDVKVKEGDKASPKMTLLEFQSNELDAQVKAIENELNAFSQRTNQQLKIESEKAKIQLEQSQKAAARREKMYEHVMISDPKLREEIDKLAKTSHKNFLKQLDELRKIPNEALRKKLDELGMISDEESENTKLIADIAQKNYQISELRENSLTAGGFEELKLRVQLANLKAQAGQSLVRSEVSGTVLTRYVEPGDFIQAGKTLFTIVGDGNTEIKVQLSERNLGQIALNQSAMVIADAYPDRPFPAKINFISSRIDPQNATVEVRLNIDKPPYFLRQNMTVSVNIETGRRHKALVIPNDAFLPVMGNETTVVIVRDGKIKHQKVTLGLRGLSMSEVVAGLKENDQVLVNSSTPLEDGERIRVVKKEYPVVNYR